MAHDIQMPQFPNPDAGLPGAWRDADNFDVDLLAEYLLDENGTGTSEVKFDFNLDTALPGSGTGSGWASPENSGHGGVPLLPKGTNVAPVTALQVAASPQFVQQAPLQFNTAQQAPSQFNTAQLAPAQFNTAQQSAPHFHPTQQVAQQATPQFQGTSQFQAPPRSAPQTTVAAQPPILPSPNLFNMSTFAAAQMNAAQMNAAQMNAASMSSNPVVFPNLPLPLPGAVGMGTTAPRSGMLLAPRTGINTQGQSTSDISIVKKRRLADAKASQAPTTPMGLPILTAATVAAPTQPTAAPTLMHDEQLAAMVAQAMRGRSGRKKSQAQIDHQREKNRVLAKKTRMRKKMFLESLHNQVLDLQRENEMLKELAKMGLEESDSKALLDQCDAVEKLPPSVLEAIGEHANNMETQDFNLVKSIQKAQHSFVITDPSLQDNPIIFVSDDYLKVTGYSREEVLGRNCRFLQGPETNADKVSAIRKGLSNGDDVAMTLINYRADGSAFWNNLYIAALRDDENNIVNYIGVVVEVAGPDPSDPEHGKILPGTFPDTEDGDE